MRIKTDKNHPLIIQLMMVLVSLLPFVALTPYLNARPPFPFGYLGLPLHEMVSGLMAGALSIFCLAALFLRRERFGAGRLDTFCLGSAFAFAAWGGLTLLWSPFLSDGYRVAGLWVCLAVFLLAGTIVTKDRSAHWLYVSMLIVGGILAAYQIGVYREKGVTFDSLFYSFALKAEILVLIIPISLATFLGARSRLLACFSLAPCALASLVELQVLRRGPILGLAVAGTGLAAALIFRWVKVEERWRLVLLLIAGVSLLGWQAIRQADQIKQRFRDATTIAEVSPTPRPAAAPADDRGRDFTLLATPAYTTSLTKRLRLAAVAWEMAKSRFPFGVGVGGYNADYDIYLRDYYRQPAYRKISGIDDGGMYEGVSTNAHNELLQMTCETGLLGAALFLAWLLSTVWVLWRRRRSVTPYYAIGALLGILAFAVSSTFTSFSLRSAPGAVMVACLLIVGLSGGSDQDGKKSLPRLVWPPAAVAVLLIAALISSALYAVRCQRVLAAQALESDLAARFFPQEPYRNEQMLADYQQVLRTDPHSPSVHLGCGLLLFQMKRPQEAVPHLEYAARHGYNRPVTQVLLAFAYEQVGNLEAANQLMAGCVASYPKSYYARAVYAELMLKQGAKETALLDRARAQKNLLLQVDPKLAHSYELVLRQRPDAAVEMAQKEGLTSPDLLPTEDALERTILMVRAYHYL